MCFFFAPPLLRRFLERRICFISSRISSIRIPVLIPESPLGYILSLNLTAGAYIVLLFCYAVFCFVVSLLLGLLVYTAVAGFFSLSVPLASVFFFRYVCTRVCKIMLWLLPIYYNPSFFFFCSAPLRRFPLLLGCTLLFLLISSPSHMFGYILCECLTDFQLSTPPPSWRVVKRGAWNGSHEFEWVLGFFYTPILFFFMVEWMLSWRLQRNFVIKYCLLIYNIIILFNFRVLFSFESIVGLTKSI